MTHDDTEVTKDDKDDRGSPNSMHVCACVCVRVRVCAHVCTYNFGIPLRPLVSFVILLSLTCHYLVIGIFAYFQPLK